MRASSRKLDEKRSKERILNTIEGPVQKLRFRGTIMWKLCDVRHTRVQDNRFLNAHLSKITSIHNILRSSLYAERRRWWNKGGGVPMLITCNAGLPTQVPAASR